MLDLNLDIISSSCDSYATKNNCKNLSSTREKIKKQMVLMEEDHDSGTSNSSIIINNYTDDQQAVETDSAFIFDIMSNKQKKNVDNLMITTHQLFPEKTTQEFIMESESKPPQVEWLKLSQMEPSGEAELKIVQQKQQHIRKSRRGPRSRSSQYRGVTFYRRTGRWESHIWDCGKQVYLGGFDTALAAARAYDRAAIKFRGVEADINFGLTDYEDDMKQMRNLNKEEFVQILRRQSTGFARGNSKYRGLTLPKSGRIGQFHGNKEAAVTTFDPTVYEGLIYNPNYNDGGGHNLELSLGISMPVKKNNHKNVKSPNFELPNKERIKMVEHKHLNTLFNLPTLPLGLLQTKQEGVTDVQVEANYLPKTSSWEWQINNAKNNFVTLSHSSVAASSGFASSSTQQLFQRRI